MMKFDFFIERLSMKETLYEEETPLLDLLFPILVIGISKRIFSFLNLQLSPLIRSFGVLTL